MRSKQSLWRRNGEHTLEEISPKKDVQMRGIVTEEGQILRLKTGVQS